MPKLPIIRFDPADIEFSLPDVAARISYKSATFLSSHRQPGLKNQLSGEMRRSSRLLAAAEKGEDNASLTRKAATQAVMEWINTMDTIAKAEKVLRDLTPVLAGSNDELFEKIISRQDCHLDATSLAAEHLGNDGSAFEETELASALRKSPITDSAAFGTWLRKQLTDLVSRPEEYRHKKKFVHVLYEKVALLILSIDPVDRRGKVDIFHSLVLMLGMFSFSDLCRIRHKIHQELLSSSAKMNSETCPAQTLSHELLETIAGTVKNHQGCIQLDQDSSPFWNFVHAWRSLIGTPACPSSELNRSLGGYPRSEASSLHRPHSKCRSRDGGCSKTLVYPVVEALREAAINEVTGKARMVCAGRLPVELSNLVVEAALIAEEMLLEPVS